MEDPAVLFEELGSSLHGRGIILTSLQFDEVRYGGKGNVVTMIKRAPVTTEPAVVTEAQAAQS